MSSSRCLALVGIAVLLAACSTAKHDEYKNAKALPPLEVPPDLINPPKDTATAVPAAGSASAAVSPPPAAGIVHLEREGAQRWLVVPGTPATVFPRVHEFLVQEGYEIAAENAVQGTLETEWRAARRWRSPRSRPCRRGCWESPPAAPPSRAACHRRCGPARCRVSAEWAPPRRWPCGADKALPESACCNTALPAGTHRRHFPWRNE